MFNGFTKPIRDSKSRAFPIVAGTSTTYTDTSHVLFNNTTNPILQSWYKTSREYTVNYKGTYRITIGFDTGGTYGYASRIQIYVNGVPRGTERASATAATWTEDITLNVGDKVQIYSWLYHAAYSHTLTDIVFAVSTSGMIS